MPKFTKNTEPDTAVDTPAPVPVSKEEALAMVIPVKTPKTILINASVYPPVKTFLEQAGKAKGLTLSEVVREALADWMKKQ